MSPEVMGAAGIVLLIASIALLRTFLRNKSNEKVMRISVEKRGVN